VVESCSQNTMFKLPKASSTMAPSCKVPGPVARGALVQVQLPVVPPVLVPEEEAVPPLVALPVVEPLVELVVGPLIVPEVLAAELEEAETPLVPMEPPVLDDELEALAVVLTPVVEPLLEVEPLLDVEPDVVWALVDAEVVPVVVPDESPPLEVRLEPVVPPIVCPPSATERVLSQADRVSAAAMLNSTFMRPPSGVCQRFPRPAGIRHGELPRLSFSAGSAKLPGYLVSKARAAAKASSRLPTPNNACTRSTSRSSASSP
jgi:hypothetical protein